MTANPKSRSHGWHSCTDHPRGSPETAPGRGCACCPAAAVVCQECVRAIALKWFGAIARHPETGTDCQLCEHGPALYCGQCFVDQVAEYRTMLRQNGVTIGEPAGWNRC
jgi:hypothetical protein